MRKFIYLSVLLLGACSRPPSPEPVVAQSPTPGKIAVEPVEPTDACGLLTNGDLIAVVKAPISETNLRREVGDGLTVSECFITPTTPEEVVTLRVVEAGGKGEPRSPRRVWQETFAKDLQAAIEHRKGGVEVVPGVGEEAFWMGGRKTGGLYVLSGDRYLRVGVSGEADQQEKIDKAKRFAEAALARLK